MGDPGRLRKRYERPKKAWEKARIESEKKLVDEFGLKNKKELLIAEAELRRIKRRARVLQGMGEAGMPEFKKLADRVVRMGIAKEGCTLDDLLGLDIRDVLSRRLETVVYKKGLAHTLSQGRQFIAHGHIGVNGGRVSAPGYIVRASDAVDYYGPKPAVLEEVPAKPAEAPKEAVPEAEKKLEVEKPAEPEAIGE